MSLSKLQETVKDRKTWRADLHGVAESDRTKQQTTKKCVGHMCEPPWKQFPQMTGASADTFTATPWENLSHTHSAESFPSTQPTDTVQL